MFLLCLLDMQLNCQCVNCFIQLVIINVLGTTDCDFGSAAYSQFLHDNGITNDGLWQREFLSLIPYGISRRFSL